MKIHSICMAKNEADVISQTLRAAIEWSDYVYLYDNGSTDSTWEQVLKLSQKYKQIIPYKQDNRPYNNGLRAEVFNYFRENSSEEDWWCRLDADEIYVDNPRIFLAKVSQEYIVVANAIFDYYFTDKDLELYNHNPSLYADDVPVEQKCRYYINNWSEPRFFRYKNDLVWYEKDGWPFGIPSQPFYPVRIWMKHYQYRSPQQIQKRLETRREAILNRVGFLHEAQSDWQTIVVDTSKWLEQASNWESIDWQPYLSNIPNSWEARIMQASQLYYDAHDHRYVVREDLMPKYGVHDTNIKDEFLVNMPWLIRNPILLAKKAFKLINQKKI